MRNDPLLPYRQIPAPPARLRASRASRLAASLACSGLYRCGTLGLWLVFVCVCAAALRISDAGAAQPSYASSTTSTVEARPPVDLSGGKPLVEMTGTAAARPPVDLSSSKPLVELTGTAGARPPVDLSSGKPLVELTSTAGAALNATASAGVVVLPLSGAIGPASADFIVRGLSRAAHDHAQLVVLQLDTPGGLDTSMRQIIKAILASPVPVATWIAPGGARAASAGTYIIYASHIAAMAPGTNLGAATPVQIGIGGNDAPKPAATPDPISPRNNDAGASKALPLDTPSTETRKQVQDASAYIRGLAQLRGRNVEWAERAVREAVSLSAREAHEQKVVDVIARDLPDLLHQLDGRTFDTADGRHRLDLAHATVTTLEADWRSRFLAVITDPNVALILLMIGMYGLFFEFANPGFVLPGVAGAISLLVGLFALQLLPVNYVGLGLIFLGLAFLIAEAFLPAFGSLGVGGVIAFAIGALMLIDTDTPGYGIPLPMIAAVTVFSALFVFTVSNLALRARRRPVVTGAEALIGSPGITLDDGLTPQDGRHAGWARVHGERWRVESTTPLPAGHAVRVTARHGLTLTVVPVSATSSHTPGSLEGDH